VTYYANCMDLISAVKDGPDYRRVRPVSEATLLR
jgi:hypothetical protein